MRTLAAKPAIMKDASRVLFQFQPRVVQASRPLRSRVVRASRPLALLILLSLTAVAAAQPVPIPNCSFEQLDEATGLPVDWSLWTPAGNLCAYTLATAHSGVASARVTDNDAKLSQGLRSKPVPVEAGKTYEAHAWVKVEDLQAGGFAIYLEYWQGGQRVLDRSTAVSQVGDWVALKVAAAVPDGATEATILIYGSSASIGTAYFDDVSLVAVE